MRRLLLILAMVGVTLQGCGSSAASDKTLDRPTTAACTPPAGGRCAADVAWPGPMMVSPSGLLLHGVIVCGGRLDVLDQSATQVTIRLHVDAVGAGAMSCARVDVKARLAAPLDGRPVRDAVTGRVVPVVMAGACRGLALRCGPTPTD